MKILVMGTGALGSVFGGFLRISGHEVHLVGRKQHIRSVKSNGLVIDGIWGQHEARGFEAAEEVSDFTGSLFDVILLPVKSHATIETSRQIVPFLKDEGIAVSVQNGLGNAEILVSQVGSHRAAAARVIFGAEITSPGTVRVTACADPVMIGSADCGEQPELDRRIKEFVSALEKTNIPAKWTPDIHSYLWAKTIYNSALNPLGALLGVNYGWLIDNPDTRTIVNQIIGEVFAVASAKQVVLPWKSKDDYIEEFYNRLMPLTREHRPSMLQDLELGRRTEIDALNGRITGYGAELGIPTPVNQVITSLIKAREIMK